MVKFLTYQMTGLVYISDGKPWLIGRIQFLYGPWAKNSFHIFKWVKNFEYPVFK